ncbi:MAG TPA: hypothetical protein VHE54_05190 [Puia sp.]|nr:hypothetical protein [Puia sp.]
MSVKFVLSLPIFLLMVLHALSQKRDTVRVRPSDLDIGGLQTGSYSYLIIRQKAPDSPATSMILAKMQVERQTWHNKPAIVVRQQWDRDSVVHTAFTVFDARDFSTLLHDTYWRALGYGMIFDFETRKFDARSVVRAMPDSMRSHYEAEFAASFGRYNLNWHDDLVIYSMLPYQGNRTFLINYYDPGFGKPEEVPYTVTGSDVVTGRGGEKIECWTLEHSDEQGTEKFWIAKKTKEVLKEQDYAPRFGYRYKLKLGVSGI